MRIGVAREEALQTNDVRAVFRADQHRAAGAGLDQRHPAQDQRMHDPFADLGLFDHQGSQIVRRDQQRLDVVDRVHVDEGRLTRQLPDVGDEVAGPLLHDRRTVSHRIAARDAHRTLDQHAHSRRDASCDEQRLAGRVVADVPEMPQPIDLVRRQLRKHLLVAVIDLHHCHAPKLNRSKRRWSPNIRLARRSEIAPLAADDGYAHP